MTITADPAHGSGTTSHKSTQPIQPGLSQSIIRLQTGPGVICRPSAQRRLYALRQMHDPVYMHFVVLYLADFPPACLWANI
jgi:hypothetical protein